MRNYSKLSKIKARAKKLRKNSTEPEEILWFSLKNRKLHGIKFRRQYPFGRYILDFYSEEKKVGIEVDGESHEVEDQIEYDRRRMHFLRNCGITIIRIQNEEITKHSDEVVEWLENKLSAM